jgi:hypothetical protein
MGYGGTILIPLSPHGEHFQTLDLTKFLTCSLYLSRGTISETTHIKIIFNFSLGIGKHFIGKALCSSDDCHATHSHFHPFHYEQCLIQTSRRKKNLEESNLENEGAREYVPSPFLSNDQEIPCPERYEQDALKELASNLMSTFISEMCCILLPFEAGYSV